MVHYSPGDDNTECKVTLAVWHKDDKPFAAFTAEGLRRKVAGMPLSAEHDKRYERATKQARTMNLEMTRRTLSKICDDPDTVIGTYARANVLRPAAAFPSVPEWNHPLIGRTVPVSKSTLHDGVFSDGDEFIEVTFERGRYDLDLQLTYTMDDDVHVQNEPSWFVDLWGLRPSEGRREEETAHSLLTMNVGTMKNAEVLSRVLPQSKLASDGVIFVSEAQELVKGVFADTPLALTDAELSGDRAARKAAVLAKLQKMESVLNAQFIAADGVIPSGDHASLGTVQAAIDYIRARLPTSLLPRHEPREAERVESTGCNYLDAWRAVVGVEQWERFVDITADAVLSPSAKAVLAALEPSLPRAELAR